MISEAAQRRLLGGGTVQDAQTDTSTGTCDDNLRCRSGKFLMYPDDMHPHYAEVPAPCKVCVHLPYQY